MQRLQKFAADYSSAYNNFSQARPLISRDTFKLKRTVALAGWRESGGTYSTALLA